MNKSGHNYRSNEERFQWVHGYADGKEEIREGNVSITEEEGKRVMMEQVPRKQGRESSSPWT